MTQQAARDSVDPVTKNLATDGPPAAAASGGDDPPGWAAQGRSYPYWDDQIESLVYKHVGPWMVSVTPQIFNDRVLLTHREQYPRRWTAGFCYDKGPAAGLAAMAWNPDEERNPAGFKRIAADERP